MTSPTKNNPLECPINNDNAPGNIKPLPKKGALPTINDLCLIHNLIKDKNTGCPECFYLKEHCEEDKLICEKCFKKSKDVRFEGLEECNICDKCLYELKGGH